jgi:hypothetical protein
VAILEDDDELFRLIQSDEQATTDYIAQELIE